MTDSPQRPPPPWDEAAAQAMIGATVLIGISRVEPAGTTQEQMWGTLIAAQAGDGFTFRLEGAHAGEILHLPPDLRNVFPAGRAEYRLRGTGEVVVDPDYTSTWTVYPPKG